VLALAPDGWTRACSRTSSKRRSIINPATKDVTLWTLHDLRRTMATGMGELGVQPHIIEAAINQQSGHKAGVAGTYNRANYHAEHKQALEKWAAHVMALVAKPKGVARAGARPGAKPLKVAAR
jgi:integrase